MNLVLDSLLQTKREHILNIVEPINDTKIYRVMDIQFTSYDFKTDTERLLKLLSIVKKESNSISSLKRVIYKIPELHKLIKIDPDNLQFDNEVYMRILQYYKTGGSHVPRSVNCSNEKFHAQNTYEILSSFDNIDKVCYEKNFSSINRSKNLLVKTVLSHQQTCFVCSRKLEVKNTTIDHLVARDDRNNSPIISEKNINSIANLGKMCDSCNQEKQNHQLLDYHFSSKGFEFYPVNVLYLLHLQRETVINNYKAPFREAYNELISYIEKYMGKFSKKSNFDKQINTLPDLLFQQHGVSRALFKEIVIK